MTILMWERPKKVRTVEEWAHHYGFEDGPTGGYMPNMSEADELAWKAKITGKKLGFPQVEIRKTTTEGSQVLIVVNLGEGYNYKQYRATKEGMMSREGYVRAYAASQYGAYDTVAEAEAGYEKAAFPTRGINVHIATNGPIQMTFDELGQMNEAIEEAKIALAAMTN